VVGSLSGSGGVTVCGAVAVTGRRGSSRRAPGWALPVAVLVGAVVLSELVGLGTSRHQLIPTEVLVDSAVLGAPDILFAVGLVLVYRAQRIINFSQGSIAVAAAIVFLTLQGEHWPYLACAAVAFFGAAAAGVVVDSLLLRRFVTAPRLVATVVTIGVGQLLVALAALLPVWRFGVPLVGASGNPNADDLRRLPSAPAHSPLSHYKLHWGVEVFTGDHAVAIAVVLVVAVGLALFFRRTNAGIAIRGAAENQEKASTLGISTGTLTSLVWALAAGLAGLSAVIGQPLTGGSLLTLGTGLGAITLLRGLTAGVIGKMEDLPTTVAAAIGIAVLDGAVYFSTTKQPIVEVVLLVVLVVALVFQRTSLSRFQAAVSGGWAAAEEVRPIPAILKDHVSVRAARRWVLLIGIVVLLGYPFAMSPTQVFLGSTFAIYGIVAISLVVLTGWGGQISLGQFAFVAVGASIGGGLAAHGWPFLIALVVATVAGGVVAVILGLPALRVRGLFLAVITLAFAVVMADFFLDPDRFAFLTPHHVPRPKLAFLNFADDRAFYFLSLAGLVVAIFVAQGLRRTRTGRVLIAMRDNERGAQALGLSLVRTRLVTFAISGALAAFAGMLYAAHDGSVRADGFGPDLSIQIFLMAVIGGLGSVAGVLSGALYLAAIQLFVSSTAWQLAASGGGVLIILLFFPAGLGGLVFAARDSFLRRVALREKILVPSLLGDLRKLDSDERRAALGPKPDVGARVSARRTYALDSEIADAGRSQRGKGWVYG